MEKKPIEKAIAKIYTPETLLNGKEGIALKALTLTALNFNLSALISNHPKLKMPSGKVSTPDEIRDVVSFGEFEKKEPIQLDILCGASLASCGLLKDVAEHQDISKTGSIIRPYAWILERVRTPYTSVIKRFDWIYSNTAKTIGVQATMLNLPNVAELEANARIKSEQQNKERLAYALAEVNSATHPAILKQDEQQLIDILLDLDGKAFDIIQVAILSAQAEVARTKARILNNDYTRIDAEVILFANSN